MSYGESLNMAQAIEWLKKLDAKGVTSVPRLDHPHSYRGYYVDLCFEPVSGETMNIRDLISLIEDTKGKTYQGWKGGDFTMGDKSEIYVAEEGNTGPGLKTFLAEWLVDQLL